MNESVNSYAEQGLKPLEALLVSDDVNEVVINPDDRIFVEYTNKAHMEEVTDVQMSEHEIHSLGSNLAGDTGNALGEDHPIVSGRVFVFGNDVRVQVVVPPAIEKGVSLSIRKYVSRVLDASEIKYVRGESIDTDAVRHWSKEGMKQHLRDEDLAEFLKSAVDNRLNILISGGTSSGKTTIARALLNLCHEKERIITIEDAIELRPTHDNVVAMVASRREGSDRTTAKLLESSLRMRPDRLIVGELRGAEAYNFLEAINTGHPGSISTIHADSPALALERIALMVMQTGVRLTRADVVDYAKQTIDLIIQVGRRDGKRGVLEIHMPQMSE
ncbi:P-type DNA transfer ATPase VirB11 [Ahrensia marina]|uniref:Type IV secretion system protein n=1 Tax=Ahrensia marina TaxID=1514904 RepID=A0A0N0VL65_9HYPH|nr:P-type DNA transfer ATPase VirB11 [Ahrensia marina]KPB00614.1 type VI secretion protein [Ahrensia marina]